MPGTQCKKNVPSPQLAPWTQGLAHVGKGSAPKSSHMPSDCVQLECAQGLSATHSYGYHHHPMLMALHRSWGLLQGCPTAAGAGGPRGETHMPHASELQGTR